MAKLSKRLKLIADHIEKGQTMADIGTDHGFLPLYLWDNSICPKIIMTDVSKFSLNKAKVAFGEYSDGEGIDFRVGNGLKVIAEKEVDVVVISGIGGILITQILGEDLRKTLSFDKFILHPATGAGKLRYWLQKAGFLTISEGLAEEGKFICEVMAVIPPKRIEAVPSLDDYREAIEHEMSDGFPNHGTELLIKFIKRKLDTEIGILKMMVEGQTGRTKKIAETEDRIRFLKEKIKEAEAFDAHRRDNKDH